MGEEKQEELSAEEIWNQEANKSAEDTLETSPDESIEEENVAEKLSHRKKSKLVRRQNQK